MAYQVFICCPNKDCIEMGAMLYDFLLKEGYRAFYAEAERSSDGFSQRMDGVLAECEDFVVLLSPDSSKNVKYPDYDPMEAIKKAGKLKKHIIPLVLDDSPVPKKGRVKWYAGLGALPGLMVFSPLLSVLGYDLAFHVIKRAIASLEDTASTEFLNKVRELLSCQPLNVNDRNLALIPESEPLALPPVLSEPYSGTQPYVFISYAHRDKETVHSIIKELMNRGCRVWYDRGIDPGTEWDDNIAAHIVECSGMVAFISKNFLDSENCKDEIKYARDIGKERLLVYLEEIELPSGMAMRLGRQHAIHYYKYTAPHEFFGELMRAPLIIKCCENSAGTVI